jgi:hypothetical protein
MHRGASVSKSANDQPDAGGSSPRFFAYLEEGKPLLLLDLGKQLDEATEATREAQRVAELPLLQARSRKRRITAVASVAGMSVLAVAGLQALPAASAPVPTKALQSVAVSLGSDGRLTAVTTTDITMDAQHKLSSAKHDLDPVTTVDKLPVVAGLAYVFTPKTGKVRTGTNLADLKDANGIVEINLTLTNTSVRTETFQVGAAGAAPTYAQVSTPLTVIATATLPKESAARLLPAPTGQFAPHSTNGLISTAGDGKAQVHWASVLAPPRLPAATTFSLVEETTKFVAPDVTIAVTPGLTADPSVDALLRTAFGEASPISTLENTTAKLITSVSEALAAVQGTLNGVSQKLTVEASTTGVTATQNLKATSATAADNLTGLVAILTSLGATVDGQLDVTRRSGQTSLDAALTKLKDNIGLPSTAAVPSASTALPTTAPTGAPRCSPTGTPAPQAETLYAELLRITGVLTDAATASDACVQDLKAVLLKTIGSKDSCPITVTPSLACRLVTSQSSLTVAHDKVIADSGALLAHLGSVLDTLDQNSLSSGVGRALSDTVASVSTLQNSLKALKTNTGQTSPLAMTLTHLQDVLADLLAQTDPTRGSGVGHEVKALHDQAVINQALVGDTSDGLAADTSLGQLKRIARAVCAVPSALVDPADDVLVLDYANAVHTLLDGTECVAAPVVPGLPIPPVTPPAFDDLKKRLKADLANWADVVALTSPTSASGPGQAVAALHADLGTVQDALGVALAQVSDKKGKPGTLLTAVGGVIDAATKIYDVTDTSGTQSADCHGRRVGQASLNALVATLSKANCDQDQVGKDLTAYTGSTSKALETLGSEVGSVTDAAARATSDAGTQLDSVLTSLTSRFKDTAASEEAKGRRQLQAQVDALALTVASSKKDLDSGATRAMKTLDDSLSTAKGSDLAASKTLASSLQDVVDNLGAPTTGGLLGDIYDKGLDVKAGGNGIKAQSDRANGFASVRDTDKQLQQLQLLQQERGVASVSDVTYLGALPPAATHVTVYTFHLAGS